MECLQCNMFFFTAPLKLLHVTPARRAKEKKASTQEDLIIIEEELPIHGKVYLQIQRLAKSEENIKNIDKIPGNNNHDHRGAPRPCGARPTAAPMVVVSFDFVDFLCVCFGFRQALYP